MRAIFLLLTLLITSNLFAFDVPSNAPITTFYQTAEVTLSATPSTLILPVDYERKYLLIQNKGATSVYLKFDTTHTATEGITITTGSSYEPAVIPNNAIYMIGTTGGELISITRGK